MPAFEAPVVDTAPTKGRLGHVLVSRRGGDGESGRRCTQGPGRLGQRLGEVLVDIGALDDRGLAEALADFFGMPVTDLKRDTPEPSALALVPSEFARDNLAIPLRVDDDRSTSPSPSRATSCASNSPTSAGTRSGFRWHP